MAISGICLSGFLNGLWWTVVCNYSAVSTAFFLWLVLSVPKKHFLTSVHKYFYIVFKKLCCHAFSGFKADGINFCAECRKDWIDVLLLTTTWLAQSHAVSSSCWDLA